jgi:hypothetical protein
VRGALAALLALVSLLSGGARGVAGPAAAPESEASTRVKMGREALKGGKSEVARHHFLDAVALDPSLVGAWLDLAGLDAADADAKALWALDAVFALTDPAGKPPKTPLGAPFAVADLVVPFELAAKRAALARGIADAATKLAGPDTVVVAKWLRWLADETASGAASLGAPARAAAEKALDRVKPDVMRVRAALEAVLAEAKTAGNLERVVEAARLLVGFSAQRRGVLGPKAPIAEGFGARHALDDARAALEAKLAPLAFEELDKLLVSDKKLEFEDAHASWANPLVVASEKGRYRIESVCGLATTREAASLIEHCHDRLVAWCGKDPFVGAGGAVKKGVVRLCPTNADLEQEGAPYWWAAGFAAGDVLTIAVHWATGDDLAQLLAHELTHRFDHGLRPRLPAWAMEGRANYVGATTSFGRAPALDERFVDFHEFEVAYRLVAWDYLKLLELLSGQDPEYRHNYPVGYSLWTFLSQWTGDGKGPTGKAPYRDVIPVLLDALEKAPNAPLKVFETTICDGRDGRAASMKGLAKHFADFLDAFYRPPEPAWVKEWRDRNDGAAGERPRDYFLGDRSNQPVARDRLDPPTEGDALAALAAVFLERVGRGPDALEAHGLADAVDELDLARYGKALALETATGRKEAAFARARLLAKAGTGGEAGAKPETGGLGPLCALAATYLDALSKASGDAAAAKPRTARALRAEHDRIAAIVGRAPLGEAGLAAPPPLAKAVLHGDPDCPPAVSPLLGGVVEDRWSAQEDGEIAGLYGLNGPDELVLGRRTGGAATTGLDRGAAWAGVAVHTKDSFVGTYTVRMRVKFETSYVEARAIVGWTRRDRGVEVAFSAGDRDYGEKKSESDQARPGLSLAMSDLRAIDRHLSTMSREASYGDPGGERDSFELTFHVAGPYVRVQIDGTDVLSMRRATGEPVEGQLGFAMDRGRARFSDVRVERHRALGAEAACRCDHFDAPLDFEVPARFSWTSLVGRRVQGLAPATGARLLLWSTGLAGADPTGAESIHTAIETCREPFTAYGYTLDVHVAARGDGAAGSPPSIPAAFPRPGGLKIPDGNLHMHHGFPALEAEAQVMPQNYEIGWPAWGGLFIDPAGVVRVRGPIDDLWKGVRLARFLAGR